MTHVLLSIRMGDAAVVVQRPALDAVTARLRQVAGLDRSTEEARHD